MIKKWYKYYVLKESIKEIELNCILDKISNGLDLTTRESEFLNLYNQINDNDCKDYSYLSVQLTCNKIEEYLEKKKKIYCDLCDRDGKISQLISTIDISKYKLTLKHDVYYLDDKHLYNISYNIKKDEYSLTCQDEYYEKIYIEE